MPRTLRFFPQTGSFPNQISTSLQLSLHSPFQRDSQKQKKTYNTCDEDDDEDDVDLGDLSGLIRASCLFINPPVKAILPKLLHQATNSGKS